MSSTRHLRRSIAPALIAAAAAATVTAAPASAAPATPDLDAAAHYLTRTTGANGIDGTSLGADGYYGSGGGYADFGLTIDGAYALAATRTDDTTLKRVVDFIDHGTDGAGRTAQTWMGVGPGDPPQYVSSGAVGKTALLAEVVGADPRSFAGQDLIADLDDEVCSAASDPNDPDVAYCAAPGAYENAYSTFSQTLGIMAALRAGDTAAAASPIAFLESEQEPSGAWPSITAGSDADVDSTGMAVMALALVPGQSAANAVARGQHWIASRQQSDGGFPGAAGDSTNSAALALLGLNLDSSSYQTQISDGLSFLADHQNDDGGFDIAANTDGSDVRASTQVVSGIVGTSFGTLSDPVDAPAPPSTTTTVTTTTPAPPTTTVVTTPAPSPTPTPAPAPRARPSHQASITSVRPVRLRWGRQHGRRIASAALVDFRLTADARVTVSMSRRVAGRWQTTLSRSSWARTGADTKRLALRHGRPLRAGRYRVVIVARDSAGHRARSRPVFVTVPGATGSGSRER